jgi:hypothetical protein
MLTLNMRISKMRTSKMRTSKMRSYRCADGQHAFSQCSFFLYCICNLSVMGGKGDTD